MYSTVVLFILFFLLLAVVWYLLINAKTHDKIVEKVEKFKKNNLEDEKENVKNEYS